MSGDNLYGEQPLEFYSEEMTETQRIAISQLGKQLFPVTNFIIYLNQKRSDSRVPKAA